MHEVAAVQRAIASVMGGDADRAVARAQAVARVRLVIREPLKAEADAVRFLATVLLRERGLSEPVVEVVVEPRRCETCGAVSVPGPTAPECDGCGLPFRPRTGPAITATLVADGVGPCAS
jgi:Zn finger protein HypA/HybF involved in hydrogenase expression